MHPAISILPQRNAYRPSYTAAAPPWPPPAAAHRGAPYFGHPCPELTLGTEPPYPHEASEPSHHRPLAPERRRAVQPSPPVALLRGAAASEHFPASRDHPKVRREPLSLFPNFPLAAGKGPRRKTPRKPLPCSVQTARDLL